MATVGLPKVESEIDPNEEIELNDDAKEGFFCSSTFLKKYLLPRAITFVFLIILFLWIYQAEGGLGNPEASIFGWHALLMSFFIIVFTQEGVMAYSSPIIGPFVRNRTVIKFFHVLCHILGVVCAIGGLISIVYYKSLSGLPILFPFYTMYSPHSWIGVCLLCLWGFQMIAGFFGQTYFRKLTPDQRRSFSKYHRFFGRFIYGLGLVTCALGFQDMQSSDLATSTPPMANMTMDEMMMMGNLSGYLPNSSLAQYSSAGCLLLLLAGFATFSTFVR